MDKQTAMNCLDEFFKDSHNRKLLNNKDFANLYISINSYLMQHSYDTENDLVSYLTEVLLSAGFNPLENLENIPARYMIKNKSLEFFEVPNNIVMIGDYAFARCTNLNNISLSNKLMFINIGSFCGCGIRSIELPDSLKFIYYSAFKECIYLQHLEIPGGVEKLFDNAFDSCINLLDVKINEGVEFIDGHVFKGCSSLKEVYLPKSIKYINNNAFEGDDNLHDIYYAGSVEEFKMIDFGILFNNLKIIWKDKNIHCNDGTIKMQL